MVVSSGTPSLTVDTTTKRFHDADGRERYFHGVNVVSKQPPWLPETDHFDVDNSLSEQDYIYLQEWGINSIRLGVMWAGVFPEARGVVNQTYLDNARAIVDQMANYSIFALVEHHQDLFSWIYCGDGAPAWACEPIKEGRFPEPLNLEPFPVDNQTFVPLDGYCGKHDWGTYYMADAVGKSFQNLYDNTYGMQDAFSEHWQVVAETFKTSQNVLGYELINEPWAGNVYKDPLLLIPGVADKVNLTPLYDRLQADIRKIDDSKIIFFEPVTWDDAGVGFEHVPGGDDFRNMSALSYHFYIPPDVNLEEAFYVRMKDLEKLECAGLLTEFGGTEGDAPKDLDSTIAQMNEAEIHMQGWMYWNYKVYAPGAYADNFFNPDGTPDMGRVGIFTRTYAQAVAGVVESTLFDAETSRFTITYTPNPDCTLPTEIYLSEAVHYPNGYEVEIIPSTGGSYTNSHNKLMVTSIGNVKLTVNINPINPSL
eukprot:gene11500-13414_t